MVKPLRNKAKQSRARLDGETFNRTKQKSRPTDEYNVFQEAFDYFNARLFGGTLLPCLISLHRKSHSNGYYSNKRYEARRETAETDELALNPATFKSRTDKEILSTLVHEMVHHWQYHFGKPSDNRYHNGEWADKMEALGLSLALLIRPTPTASFRHGCRRRCGPVLPCIGLPRRPGCVARLLPQRETPSTASRRDAHGSSPECWQIPTILESTAPSGHPRH
jgi:hypothetical protein